MGRLRERRSARTTRAEIAGSRRPARKRSRWIAILLAGAALAGCSKGSAGNAGPAGPAGQPGCPGLAPGQTPGLHAALTISAPPNGQYFQVGERPVLTAKLTNDCGAVLRPADIEQGWLLLSGPRAPTATKTASKMLNAITDRAAADRQHHYINLKSPNYAVAGQNNLVVQGDGTLVYNFAAVSDEAPGTYTVGLWLKNAKEHDQIFPQTDLQIGTPTAEAYASGPADAASCLDCHKGAANGKVYMHHIEPGFSPYGNFALDSAPVGTCKQCHNLDGYSLNPALRKVHSVHRGEHLTTDKKGVLGGDHPEFGMPFDATMSAFTNVAFPSMPGAERDCTKCHTTDSWKTSPSRLACGTCHTNVSFQDTGAGFGALDPARVVGKPASGPCTTPFDPANPIAPECSALGGYLSCNADATSPDVGKCERRVHPAQSDDSRCVVCHVSGSAAAPLSSIPDKHAIAQRVNDPGYVISNVTVLGASGPAGTFRQGDPVGFTFKIADRTGAVVTNFQTATTWTGTATLSGPTDDMQRVWPAESIKNPAQGTLTFDSVAQTYTYTFPNLAAGNGWPVNAQPPLNTDPTAPTRVNPAGSYTLWFYVVNTINGQRETADHAETVRYLDDKAPVRPRQIVTREACNSCHVELQLHGGQRKNPQTCNVCHNQGALDRVASPAAVAGKGAACLADTDCLGGASTIPVAQRWETCVGAAPPTKGVCTMSQDPTPGATIDLPVLVHKIHFARKLDGFAEQGNFFNPGKLQFVGFNNSLLSFNEVLLSQDVRNCTKCHADTGATCSASAPCGVGQSCQSGKCVNTAWQQPSARACLTCHDMDDSYAHAAIMTAPPAAGQPPLESCNVCHGPGADFSVANVHNITSPYVPPYTRE